MRRLPALFLWEEIQCADRVGLTLPLPIMDSLFCVVGAQNMMLRYISGIYLSLKQNLNSQVPSFFPVQYSKAKHCHWDASRQGCQEHKIFCSVWGYLNK